MTTQKDTIKPEEGAQKKLYAANVKKWSAPLMDVGYNVIPNIIIEQQVGLGLDALDMNILLHLTTYWWQAENLPHPSLSTLAARMGKTSRTVQRRLQLMEKRGLIKRIQRRKGNQSNDTNHYSFAGLIKAATPLAVAELANREASAKNKRTKKHS